jgi:thiol:disulfide interchange protein DsbD
MARLLMALVGVALLLWLAHTGALRSLMAKVAALLALGALLAWSWPSEPPAAQAQASGNAAATEAGWLPYDEQVLARLAAEGRTVFVDFTAAWCVTCQVNKQTVLHTASVGKAFDASGVVKMRADWTNRDEAITKELARFNRNGVPLYVLFDPKGTAHVLPELLTERTVLDALARVEKTATAQSDTTPTATR